MKYKKEVKTNQKKQKAQHTIMKALQITKHNTWLLNFMMIIPH